MKLIPVVLLFVISLSVSGSQSDDYLSRVDLQTKITAIKKIRIVLPVKHYLQKDRLFTNKILLRPNSPYCHFTPYREIHTIFPGDSSEIVKIKGRVSKFRLKSPFKYSFNFNPDDVLSEFTCFNIKGSSAELYIDEFKKIFRSYFSVEIVLQDRAEHSSDLNIIDLTKDTQFHFYEKFGFFHNRILYFQNGSILTSTVDLKRGSYCYLSTNTKEMVIHPNDMSAPKRISGRYTIGNIIDFGFLSSIELKDLDLDINCREISVQQKTSIKSFQKHFGKYLTIINKTKNSEFPATVW